MKLLDTNASNTKILKTQKDTKQYRVASLSLLPTNELCPGAKLAGCFDTCLKTSGLAAFTPGINDARARKTEFYLNDRQGFIDQLKKELSNFEKLCTRQGKKALVRLNVLSDIDYIKLGIIEAFPNITFYDYTKLSYRLKKSARLKNYHLMFSYSPRQEYQNQVKEALKTDAPIAVVFDTKKGQEFPAEFLGRPVIDGDLSDWQNAIAGPVVVGLRAKGEAKKNPGEFVVRADLIAIAS